MAAQTVKLHGECVEPASRTPAGGIDKLPDEFPSAAPPNFVEQCSFLPGTVNAKWVRPPQWELTEALQGGKVQQGGSMTLNPLRSLTKKRTYGRQRAQQPPCSALLEDPSMTPR